MKTMMTVQEAAALIEAGNKLLVAGDEQLLAALPKGDWIGATIPYFMGEEGGVCTHERLQATVLPEYVKSVNARFYSADELKTIPQDYVANGFATVALPAFTEVHTVFAKDCSSWPNVFDRPLVGWVAGTDLEQKVGAVPKVFHGKTGASSAEDAIVMHIELENGYYARANIINLFRMEEGDVLKFPVCSFEVDECLVNGEKRNFAEYLAEKHLDLRCPLIANYFGALVNVSFKSVDVDTGKVQFFAPVFPGISYHLAAPVDDYETEFRKHLEMNSRAGAAPVVSCNCILNYQHARLEGKKTGPLVGPVTFGEIAYMLLNQTLVYLTIENK